jgi:hypothetical protein
MAIARCYYRGSSTNEEFVLGNKRFAGDRRSEVIGHWSLMVICGHLWSLMVIDWNSEFPDPVGRKRRRIGNRHKVSKVFQNFILNYQTMKQIVFAISAIVIVFAAFALQPNIPGCHARKVSRVISRIQIRRTFE